MKFPTKWWKTEKYWALTSNYEEKQVIGDEFIHYYFEIEKDGDLCFYNKKGGDVYGRKRLHIICNWSSINSILLKDAYQ